MIELIHIFYTTLKKKRTQNSNLNKYEDQDQLTVGSFFIPKVVFIYRYLNTLLGSITIFDKMDLLNK